MRGINILSAENYRLVQYVYRRKTSILTRSHQLKRMFLRSWSFGDPLIYSVSIAKEQRKCSVKNVRLSNCISYNRRYLDVGNGHSQTGIFQRGRGRYRAFIS